LSGQVQGEDHKLYQRSAPWLFALGAPDKPEAPVEHLGPFVFEAGVQHYPARTALD
jgi:hypothetical protein